MSSPPSRSATRESSDGSTWSQIINDPREEGVTAAGQTGLWSLLNAASRYDDPDSEDDSDESSQGPHTPSVGSASQTVLVSEPDEVPDISRQHGLSNAARLAKLTVNNYSLPSTQTAGLYGDTGESKVPPPPPAPTRDGKRVVAVLQREFGVWTHGDEVEEFIKETDCALLTDITILGTVQLTNYRMTFHASLLSARPDLAPTAQVIKAGPFIVHRPGLRRKRRRWLELSHDMLSSYANATDKARSRPLLSVLLSNIQKVHDFDPEQPTYVRITFAKHNGENCGGLEFDTPESAVDWRREIHAAVFRYRQRRAAALDESKGGWTEGSGTADEGRGVRICIPLHRVETFSVQPFTDFGAVLTIGVNDEPVLFDRAETMDSPPARFVPLRHVVSLPGSPAATSFSPSRGSWNGGATGSTTRELKIWIFKRAGSLPPNIPALIEAACTRHAKHAAEGTTIPEGDVVTVDFGPLTFADTEENIILSEDLTPSPPKTRSETMEHRMRLIFAIAPDVTVFIHRAWLAGKVACFGYLLVSSTYLCYWVKSFATSDTRLRFPIREVNTARPLSSTLFGHYLLGVEIKGKPLIQFALSSRELRDAVVKRILASKAHAQSLTASGAPSHRLSLPDSMNITARLGPADDASNAQSTPDVSPANGARISGLGSGLVSGKTTPSLMSSGTRSGLSSGKLEDDAVYAAHLSTDPSTIDSNMTLYSERRGSSTSLSLSASLSNVGVGPDGSKKLSSATVLAPLSHMIDFVRSHEIPAELLARFTKPINLPDNLLRGMKSRHFVCLTIGSRGDVQPYIALCKGLIAEGHRATIVTHDEYKDWIKSFGIGHRATGGDPGALMKLSVEHSMFSPQFFKETLGKFRGWLDDLLRDSWLGCQDADVLIESPSAMAGIHIAEALRIPYIRAFTMPWTRTQSYPHAFLSPPVELSGSLNYSTYVLFDNIFWTAQAGQINRWRKKMLQIKPTDIDTLAQSKIPFLYNFSDSVVPKPLDWSDIISISGYWFLDNPDVNWTPSDKLLAFIKSARDDQVPIVYIGFGSIVVPHPHAMTRSIIKGVQKAGVRAIISKGWSDRLSKDTGVEPELPPECFALDRVPHDWLFPQIDAAMHHGGAGTTGASLRAGIPTIIKPWFGDQYFWASRVHKLGAGLRIDDLGSTQLANALKRATSDRVMKEKAAAVGEKIRAEDGVRKAIGTIYTYLERAGKDRTTL